LSADTGIFRYQVFNHQFMDTPRGQCEMSFWNNTITLLGPLHPRPALLANWMTNPISPRRTTCTCHVERHRKNAHTRVAGLGWAVLPPSDPQSLILRSLKAKKWNMRCRCWTGEGAPSSISFAKANCIFLLLSSDLLWIQPSRSPLSTYYEYPCPPSFA